MIITVEEIESFIDRPSEGLSREIKAWLDPASPQGIQKIVTACFALRNRNGGFLLIGFNNQTLQPERAGVPPNVETAFHVDVIQGLITRYASHPFEVAVGFGRRGGLTFPVIKVEDGVRSPVAVKSTYNDPSSGRPLLTEGDVYFRTLRSNGTPSSARALWRDWPDIVEICFENREADIGRFLRRHLGSDAVHRFVGIADATRPTLRDRAIELLSEGRRYFEQDFQDRSSSGALTREEVDKIQRGTWNVALVIEPKHDDARATQAVLNAIATSNPNYTGWPIWLDSRGFTDQSAAPRSVAGAWQAFIASFGSGISDHFDFWRIDPKGFFYLRRTLQDDLTDRVTPLTQFDVLLATIRTAEAIAVGLSLAKALGWDESATLGFGFEWTRLRGRTLSSWVNPLVLMNPGRTAHDDSVQTFVEVPAGTPHSAIAPYVDAALSDLFMVFGGYECPSEVSEHWVRRLVERRL
jgi:hypothetical protein